MTTDTPDRFEDRLLHRILADFDELSAGAAAPTPPRGPQRRRLRRARRLRLAVPAAALAAAAAAAVVVVTHHASVPRARDVPATVAARPAGVVLYRLAADAARAPALTRRYVILSETDTGVDQPGQVSHRTSVDDARTGSSVTYQSPASLGGGTSVPSVVRFGPAAPGDPQPDQHPESWYAALPTRPAALATALLGLARRTDRVDARANARAVRRQGGRMPTRPGRPPSAADLVYDEAWQLLWNPLVQPDLRAALYRVLAAQTHVSVDVHATDPSGRPAIRISRSWSAYDEPQTETIYEDPHTGRTLAQTYRVLRQRSTSVFTPVRSSDTIPPDPYRS